MNKLEPHDFVVFRRPLLPYTMLRRLNYRLAQKPELLRTLLCNTYKRHILREALYLASPALYDSLLKLENTAESEPVEQKVLLSLYKYLVRATSRCTPFGLFAGYFVAKLDKETDLLFTGGMRKHTTLSADVLDQISRRTVLPDDDEILRVNSSLYGNGNYLRFTERAASQNGSCEFVLKEVRNDPFLSAAIKAAERGEKAITIIETLCRQGVSKHDATTYVWQLYEEQILTGNAELSTSLSEFQNLLKTRARAEPRLANIFRAATTMSKGKQNGPSRFTALEASLAEVGISERNPVQIDIEFETARATVSRETVEGIVKDLGKLLGTTLNHTPGALKSFAERFRQRYGDKQVPLLLVLDPSLGIGYGKMESSYFGHVPLASNGKPQQMSTFSEVERGKLIDKVYHDARHHKRKFYLLTDQDLKLLQPSKPPRIAEGISALGNVFSYSEYDFDRGKYLFELRGISGPGAVDLLSRFADADTSLADRIRDVKGIEAEHYPGAIVAEVNYVPAGREANVARRPELGDHHINLMCAPGQRGIAIATSDLLVSVRAGKIIVSSASMQKRIIPRLTTAYNSRLGPSLYQFLADLAVSGTALTPIWDWGHLSESPFLPRIQYRGIVIRKACWNLDPSWLPDNPTSDQKLLEWWKKLEKELDIPRFVMIGSGDQLLSIDGHSAPAARICLNKLRKDGKLCIYEAIHALKSGFLRTGRKMYFNEMVIPIFNQISPEVIAPFPPIPDHNSPRWVSADQGWTYLKIYGSEETCERLLIGKLFDFCLRLQRAGRIQSWFYIRFKDPDPHLRLRLFSGRSKRQDTKFATDLATVLKDEIENGLVFRLQSELYERELERYSSIPYEDIESIFCSDSYAITSCIAALQLNGQQKERWLVAMMACDGLLTSFGKFDPSMKLHTLHAAGSVLEKNDIVSLDQQFRTHKQQIIETMVLGSTPFADIRHLLNQRNATIMQTLALSPINDPVSQQTMLIDLMHLCCNRLFISDQRRQEYAIYHFLKKFYDYQLKSKKTAAKIC